MCVLRQAERPCVHYPCRRCRKFLVHGGRVGPHPFVHCLYNDDDDDDDDDDDENDDDDDDDDDDNNNNNNNNNSNNNDDDDSNDECISRAPFHVKHALLR